MQDIKFSFLLKVSLYKYCTGWATNLWTILELVKPNQERANTANILKNKCLKITLKIQMSFSNPYRPII